MEKEVKEIEKEVKKDALLDIVFASLEAGKSTKTIIKELSISKQKLQYYLNKLKSDGRITKLGYGVWQTSKNRVANLCRGHGFMWHLKLPKEVEGWDKILTNRHIEFKLINSNHTYQIYLDNNKIWLSSKSIIIYDIGSYFGYNAIQSRKLGFYALKELLIKLQSKLGVNLRDKQDNFIVKPSRQHYSLIKNCLAVQCNKEGKKINVYNEKGIWFTIDNSFNLEEAETIHPKTALTDSLGIQKYFNEHKETNFEVTPKFILSTMQGIQNNQLIFAENMKSHIEAIQSLSKGVKRLTRVMSGILKENNDLKLSNKHQTRLGDF
jgi:hypothetical protein